ncbi:hypothetical protein [Chryseobacterium sp. SLBN-27]|uniref:hypothetical protein n=1 Tax=Chryseobacterium sp. SLBN-27 TaxID=3042287 RepID=UPI00286C1AE4|nr:hypothetical protein [Chryseobacterium sp. SLBN-27]
MSQEDFIKKLLQEDLQAKEKQEKYFEILDKRIEENRKSLGELFIVLIFCVLANHLLLQTKISEINLGPFKITDNKIIFGLLPTIYTLVYYKYLMIWVEISDQKRIYSIITSNYFSLNNKSLLFDKIKPFSIIDSIDRHQKSKSTFGCLTNLIWIPIALFVLISPFLYEYYLIYQLFIDLQPKNLFDWFLFICPILISLYTIMMLINVIKNQFSSDKK